ncbi:hypothetical protein NPIL_338491 [Nephila pilipes]|uniref:Uncharacterized protein n=1 Tax=Nephila pilipes TaxID=299642 RepID=A0A8X6MEB2_NEPPI|nr:hypothetical protein NPIL_338491 [Nephila pilipes]
METGGVCKCKEYEKSAKNVAVINTKSQSNSGETLKSLSWRMTEVISQLMGSVEKDCESLTNSSQDKDSLEECRKINMEKTLASQGKNHISPRCFEIIIAIKDVLVL